jgi:hypothetical protein
MGSRTHVKRGLVVAKRRAALLDHARSIDATSHRAEDVLAGECRFAWVQAQRDQ